MNALTNEQKTLHYEALERSRTYKKAEWQLILVLQKIDHCQLYKKLNCSSLFQYAVRELGFSESQAYAFIMVARKATEFNVLASALKNQKLTVFKAIRLVSALNKDSAEGLVEFAQIHSSREIDFEVARVSPKARKAEQVKAIDEDRAEITITISRSALKKFERVQALEAQRGKSGNKPEAFEAAMDDYLFHRDPVTKAERVLARNRGKQVTNSQNSQPDHDKTSLHSQLCLSKVPRRVMLSAEQKHEVFSRDRGRCTHIDEHGNRCTHDRWLHIHHIQPVSKGGSNRSSNLTTLCSYHHDLAHQLSLPIEGQVTWLRSPRVGYR